MTRTIEVGLAALVVVVVALSPGVVGAQEGVEQDPELLRFVERFVPWYPGSSFTLTGDETVRTPSGSYRSVEVERECGNKYLAGVVRLIVDLKTGIAYPGAVANLPSEEEGMDPSNLRGFLEDFLPDALSRSMRLKCKVDWDAGGLPTGAVIPFQLEVDTGYGTYAKQVAVTSDARYVVLAGGMPFDEDPVAYRREILASSDQVVWDSPSPEAKVEIVEFSDFECPGCKAKWPLVAEVLEANGSHVRHGFVAFPLTTIHPWAFRAASAGICVARQDPEALIELKEMFYAMQRDMEVSLVTQTALDFVNGNSLDREEFLACYLRKPSLDAVHSQIGLGHQLGVNATPTYFVNGWKIQFPEEPWFADMVRRMVAGEEP